MDNCLWQKAYDQVNNTVDAKFLNEDSKFDRAWVIYLSMIGNQIVEDKSVQFYLPHMQAPPPPF